MIRSPKSTGFLGWALGSAAKARAFLGWPATADPITWTIEAKEVSPYGQDSGYGTPATVNFTPVKHAPKCFLDPLGIVWGSNPLTEWTWTDHYGFIQIAFDLTLATDSQFTNIVFASGQTLSRAMSYRHTGLTPGKYYRRLSVCTASASGALAIDPLKWSLPDFDSFTVLAKTSQSDLVTLHRAWPDGTQSRIRVPFSSPIATSRYSDYSEFEFVMNALSPAPERNLLACHDFCETSGDTAHDLFGPYDLALVGSPVWSGGVLYLASDYGDSFEVQQDLGADFAAYLVLRPNGTSGCLWYFGSYATDEDFYSIAYDGAEAVKIVTSDGESDPLEVDPAGYCILRLKKAGSTMWLRNITSGESVSCAAPELEGVGRVSIGHFGGVSGGDAVDLARVAHHLLYGSTLTTAEEDQVVAHLCDTLVHRGITA